MYYVSDSSKDCYIGNAIEPIAIGDAAGNLYLISGGEEGKFSYSSVHNKEDIMLPEKQYVNPSTKIKLLTYCLYKIGPGTPQKILRKNLKIVFRGSDIINVTPPNVCDISWGRNGNDYLDLNILFAYLGDGGRSSMVYDYSVIEGIQPVTFVFKISDFSLVSSLNHCKTNLTKGGFIDLSTSSAPLFLAQIQSHHRNRYCIAIGRNLTSFTNSYVVFRWLTNDNKFKEEDFLSILIKKEFTYNDMNGGPLNSVYRRLTNDKKYYKVREWITKSNIDIT